MTSGVGETSGIRIWKDKVINNISYFSITVCVLVSSGRRRTGGVKGKRQQMSDSSDDDETVQENISITEDEDNTQVDKQVAEPSNGETVQGEAECDGIPQKLTISMSDGARLFVIFLQRQMTDLLNKFITPNAPTPDSTGIYT